MNLRTYSDSEVLRAAHSGYAGTREYYSALMVELSARSMRIEYAITPDQIEQIKEESYDDGYDAGFEDGYTECKLG